MIESLSRQKLVSGDIGLLPPSNDLEKVAEVDANVLPIFDRAKMHSDAAQDRMQGNR